MNILRRGPDHPCWRLWHNNDGDGDCHNNDGDNYHRSLWHNNDGDDCDLVSQRATCCLAERGSALVNWELKVPGNDQEPLWSSRIRIRMKVRPSWFWLEEWWHVKICFGTSNSHPDFAPFFVNSLLHLAFPFFVSLSSILSSLNSALGQTTQAAAERTFSWFSRTKNPGLQLEFDFHQSRLLAFLRIQGCYLQALINSCAERQLQDLIHSCCQQHDLWRGEDTLDLPQAMWTSSSPSWIGQKCSQMQIWLLGEFLNRVCLALC